MLCCSLCCVVKHLGSGQSTKEAVGETQNVVECFSLSSLAASWALYNRTEQSTVLKGFFMFYDKEAVKFLTHYFLLNFETKLLADYGMTAFISSIIL